MFFYKKLEKREKLTDNPKHNKIFFSRLFLFSNLLFFLFLIPTAYAESDEITGLQKTPEPFFKYPENNPYSLITTTLSLLVVLIILDSERKLKLLLSKQIRSLVLIVLFSTSIFTIPYSISTNYWSYAYAQSNENENIYNDSLAEKQSKVKKCIMKKELRFPITPYLWLPRQNQVLIFQNN